MSSLPVPRYLFPWGRASSPAQMKDKYYQDLSNGEIHCHFRNEQLGWQFADGDGVDGVGADAVLLLILLSRVVAV